MKKPARRQRRPEERPDEIAHAALTVICKRGYYESTLDDIAEAAGVTKGAVYHHFKSKEDLVVVAVRSYLERSTGRLAEVVESSREAGAEEKVRRILLAGVELWTSPNFGAVLALALGGVGKAVPRLRRSFLEHGPLRAWSVLAEAIQEGQASGQFRRDVDAAAVARQVASSLALQCLLGAEAGISLGKGESAQKAIALSLTLLTAGTRQGNVRRGPPAATRRSSQS